MRQDEKVMANPGGRRSRKETQAYLDLNLVYWAYFGYGISVPTALPAQD
jgi:hypothetical protein